jgi:hypothetical protein
MTPVYIIVTLCVACLIVTAKYLSWIVNGTGEQTQESKDIIRIENEMLVRRMIDLSRIINQRTLNEHTTIEPSL